MTAPPWTTSPPKRIAIFRALFLGDLLCAVPAIDAVKRRFPEAELTLIALPWAADLAGRIPAVDRFLPYPGHPGLPESPRADADGDAFLAAVRDQRYDLAIQMHGSGGVTNGIVADFGAATTLGYAIERSAQDQSAPSSAMTPRPTPSFRAEPGGGDIASFRAEPAAGVEESLRATREPSSVRPITHDVARTDDDRRHTRTLPWREDEHEIRRWLRLVGALGAQTGGTGIGIAVREHERARVVEALAALPETGGPVVALHGGAKDPARRWPAARFAAIGDALAEDQGARIVLTGGAGEQGLAEEIGGRMRRPSLNLAGATELGEFFALIEALDLLVTNDTGASHVAAATRTPSVVLFGPSRPARWAPLDATLHTAIDARRMVGDRTDPDRALAELPVSVVLDAAAEKLAAGNRSAPAPVAFGMRVRSGVEVR